MTLLEQLLQPQPETKLIPAFCLKPGHVVLYEDGTQQKVTSAGYGDPLEHGFYRFKDRTSAPWVVVFEGGRQHVCNRDVPVRVLA